MKKLLIYVSSILNVLGYINKIPVINYAVEESYNSLNTFNEYKELNNKIK